MRSDGLSQESVCLDSPLKRNPFRHYTFAMSFTEVLDELPSLTFEERQILIRRAIELDEPPLSEADEAIMESRLARHHDDPDSSIPLEESKAHIRSRIR